jgi:hypothetical protein
MYVRVSTAHITGEARNMKLISGGAPRTDPPGCDMVLRATGTTIQKRVDHGTN